MGQEANSKHNNKSFKTTTHTLKIEKKKKKQIQCWNCYKSIWHLLNKRFGGKGLRLERALRVITGQSHLELFYNYCGFPYQLDSIFTASFPFSHFKFNYGNDSLHVALWIFSLQVMFLNVNFNIKFHEQIVNLSQSWRGHSDSRQGRNHVSNQATRDGIRLKDLQKCLALRCKTFLDALTWGTRQSDNPVDTDNNETGAAH